MTTTHYRASDGDYIDADYGKFLDDMQAEAGFGFGKYPEICVSLNSEKTIRVLVANDENTEWKWDRSFPIPQGWDVGQVKEMFSGDVYLLPCAPST